MRMMRTLLAAVSLLFLLSSIVPYAFAAQTPAKTVSGRVTAVEPEAIVVDVGSGEKTLTVGAIVQPDTSVVVEGKASPIDRLTDEVKVGDTVTLSYMTTSDLYATKITKR